MSDKLQFVVRCQRCPVNDKLKFVGPSLAVGVWDTLADELIGLSFRQLAGGRVDTMGERSLWGCWFDVARINDHIERRTPLSLIASRAPVFVVRGILSLISFPGLNHERVVNTYAADVNAQLVGVRVFRNANQAKPALAIFGP